jgi:hypothetical protein
VNFRDRRDSKSGAPVSPKATGGFTTDPGRGGLPRRPMRTRGRFWPSLNRKYHVFRPVTQCRPLTTRSQ